MRIFVDAGHGGADPGASFNGLIEKEIALSISLRLAQTLEDNGHSVQLSRESDIFLSLNERAEKANEWLADVFLSVHLNADPDEDAPDMPEAKGYEAWIYPESEKGSAVAECILAAMRFAFPDRQVRGVKSANFAVLRLTKMPAVLLEVAFIDTLESARLTEVEIQERLAAAIAEGVQGFSNIEARGVV